MNLLWLTHIPIDSPLWPGSRHYHLLNRLADKHKIHIVTWRKTSGLGQLLRLGQWDFKPTSNGGEYTIQLGPHLPNPRPGLPNPLHLAMNQPLYRRAVERITREVKPQALVYSSAEHAAGSPHFPDDVPILFDFLDISWEPVMSRFVTGASRIAAVSPGLCEISERLGKRAELIPNGVSLSAYSAGKRKTAKRELGLEDRLVVSLIGLTCDPSLYFVDALAKLQQLRPELCLLIAGGGRRREEIARRAKTVRLRDLVAPGHIPVSDIAPYFLATDVGLYPGADIPYYRTSCPIKIMEYAAAGCQVVSSPVDMFRDWPNVRTAEPGVEPFARSIGEALHSPRPCPDLSDYDWDLLAARFNGILETL